VVKDMVKGSPFKPTYPSVIFLGDGNWLFAKINPNTGIHDALPKIEAAFKRIITSSPFDYKFVDEEYGLKFATEERIGKLATFFAILAIFISCMGLFGLASYIAEQRTKEIGVRKVLGASVLNLWSLLSKDFVVLVIISCFIAIPVAWYFLSGWLQKYEYRINMSWWVFAGAAISAVLITLLTVSFQAIKAATANPVKSLRTE
jgi:ABC-type antimicrobial peptide transport system permease subunit